MKYLTYAYIGALLGAGALLIEQAIDVAAERAAAYQECLSVEAVYHTNQTAAQRCK